MGVMCSVSEAGNPDGWLRQEPDGNLSMNSSIEAYAAILQAVSTVAAARQDAQQRRAAAPSSQGTTTSSNGHLRNKPMRSSSGRKKIPPPLPTFVAGKTQVAANPLVPPPLHEQPNELSTGTEGSASDPEPQLAIAEEGSLEQRVSCAVIAPRCVQELQPAAGGAQKKTLYTVGTAPHTAPARVSQPRQPTPPKATPSTPSRSWGKKASEEALRDWLESQAQQSTAGDVA